MLAQLLQRMILAQWALGAGLGYLLVAYANQPGWVPWVTAALMPLLTMALVDVVSALQSMAPGEPMRMWWRSLWGEYLAGVRIFLLRQPWATGTPAVLPATGTSTQVPVVLVHGYLCNHRIWDPIATALRADGHAVLAVDLEPLFTSIDDYAPTVEAAVRALCQHTGADQVALVGHSMGGLAIRAWMRAEGTHRVARVLTLGTPHAGTRIKPNRHALNGRQMAWHSDWLQQLSAQESEATRALVRIAITPQDNIVFPQRAQVLPGATAVVFEGIGHLQMCLDAQVIAWVREQLAPASST